MMVVVVVVITAIPLTMCSMLAGWMGTFSIQIWITYAMIWVFTRSRERGKHAMLHRTLAGHYQTACNLISTCTISTTTRESAETKGSWQSGCSYTGWW